MKTRPLSVSDLTGENFFFLSRLFFPFRLLSHINFAFPRQSCSLQCRFCPGPPCSPVEACSILLAARSTHSRFMQDALQLEIGSMVGGKPSLQASLTNHPSIWSNSHLPSESKQSPQLSSPVILHENPCNRDARPVPMLTLQSQPPLPLLFLSLQKREQTRLGPFAVTCQLG